MLYVLYSSSDQNSISYYPIREGYLGLGCYSFVRTPIYTYFSILYVYRVNPTKLSNLSLCKHKISEVHIICNGMIRERKKHQI